MHNHRVCLLFVAAASLGPAWPVWANDRVTEAQARLLACRAAQADCYRKLAESVYGVRITSETYVRDFVAESDQIRSAVTVFLQGIRLGTQRHYEDGVCEVDAEVTIGSLVTTLKEIHATHYEGRSVRSADFESIRQTFKTDTLRVTGSGVPRPDLPPDLPEGIDALLPPLPPGYVPPATSVPMIWRTAGPQARLMAERAARVDAMRRLLEQVKGLRLNSDTLVRDFIAESDEIAARADGIVIGAYQVKRYLHDSELMVEVTMELPVEKVVTRIEELHAQYYYGNKVSTAQIASIKTRLERKSIRATGSGVPPRRFISGAAGVDLEIPEWMEDRLEAVGEGTDPEMDTAQGRLRAAAAAKVDAGRKLAEQLYGLRITGATTVRDFVTEHDEIRTQVEAVLSGAVTGAPTFTGGIARVRVSLPAVSVWSVVHQHRLILQRRR